MTAYISTFGLLFFSLLGWGLLVNKKFKINPAFIPIFIFSSITSLVFFAGLFKIMPFMVTLITYSGLLLFIIFTFRLFSKRYEIKWLLNPSSIFFIVLVFCAILLLKGVIYLHYDNFSHWGLIVKEMYLMRGLPDSTAMVLFRNYPPGSAVFIYYIVEVLGYSESRALMAQGFLLAAAVVVLLVFCDWKKPFAIILSVISSLTLLFVIKGHIYNLLVDTLLGIVALSVAVIAYFYRNDWKKSLLVNAPILILLVLIKDSGKLFIVINAILILAFVYWNSLRGNRFSIAKSKIAVIAIIFTLLLPFGTNFLWSKYTEKAYPEFTYESNKFAITNEILNADDKSDELKNNLGANLIKASTSPDNPNVLSMIILSGISIVLMILSYMKTKKVSRLLLFSTILVNSIYFLYMMFLYLMYLYLMPENESARLAGFSRYQATMFIYYAGILMGAITLEWTKYASSIKSKILELGVTLGLSFLFFYPFIENVPTITTKPDPTGSIREKVKYGNEVIRATSSEEATVVYYSPKSVNDNGYLRYLATYEQLTNNYYIYRSSDTQEKKASLLYHIKKSDFLVVVESDGDLSEFLKKYSDAHSEGTYKVIVNNGELKLSKLP
ncbi:hypothetical protein ACQCT5_06275 [Sutcliffiella halmapala]